jgi:hypothetical protein
MSRPNELASATSHIEISSRTRSLRYYGSASSFPSASTTLFSVSTRTRPLGAPILHDVQPLDLLVNQSLAGFAGQDEKLEDCIAADFPAPSDTTCPGGDSVWL